VRGDHVEPDQPAVDVLDDRGDADQLADRAGREMLQLDPAADTGRTLVQLRIDRGAGGLLGPGEQTRGAEDGQSRSVQLVLLVMILAALAALATGGRLFAIAAGVALMLFTAMRRRSEPEAAAQHAAQ
jgi:hypothetical protein